MDIKKEKHKLEHYLNKIDKIKTSIVDANELSNTELEILKNYLLRAYEEVVLLNFKLESIIAISTSSIETEVPSPVMDNENEEAKSDIQARDAKPDPVFIKTPEEQISTEKIIEKSQELTNSLNDLLKSNRKEINSFSTFSKSFSDLVSLNDRIAFTNELFNKDSSAYRELLKVIDNAKSQKEVITYIEENVSSKFNWKDDNQVVEQFYHLLSLKYN